MTIIINSKTTKKEFSEILKKITLKKNPKSLRKVFGTFIMEGNPVEIQKKMRNEWD